MPALEAAIQATLRGGLAEKYDAQCIAELLTVGQTVAGAAYTYANYISRLCYGRIDGRFAGQESDLRLLVGTATLAHAASLYRTNNSEASAVRTLRELTGGVRASVHIPGVQGNKQDALVILGTGRRNAIAPIWQGVEITVDRVTKAGAGTVEIFAALYAAFSVSRADGFSRQETQHA